MKSQSNFVLVRAGDRTDALVKGAFAQRHLPARPLDRARLRRLLRIATGIVEHTRARIAAMEEVLCAAR